MDSEIQLCVEELKKVYGISPVTSNDCQQTKHFIWRLQRVCKTIDDFLYVITNVTHTQKSNRLHAFVRSAIAHAETIEHVRTIWPFLPISWKEERRALLRKVAEAATSKDELCRILREFDIL